MVGLSYKGMPVILPDDVSIPWEIEDDLFAFDRVGQAFSWPIKIPKKGNEHIFHFAGDVQNPRNRFKTIDGFAVTTGGNIWWSVSLVLEKSDIDWYEGSLTTVESILSLKKDLLINDLLELSDLVDGVDKDEFELTFYDHSKASTIYDEIQLPEVSTLDSIYLLKLAQKALEQIGYTFLNNAPSESLLHKVSLFQTYFPNKANRNTQFFGNPPINEMPSLTLGELLQEVIFYSGGSILVNSSTKTVHLNVGVTPTNLIDLSGKMELVKINDPEAIDISVGYRDTKPLDDIPVFGESEKRTGTYLGSYASREHLEDQLLATASVGDYAFSVLDNAYFTFLEDHDTNLYTSYYSWPFDKVESDEEKVQEFESNLIPVHRTRYLYYYNPDKINVRNNGAGKVRLKGLHNARMLLITAEVTFIDENNVHHGQNQVWYELSAVASTPYTDGYDGSNWVDLDLDFVEKMEIEGLYIRVKYHSWIPILEATTTNEKVRTYAGSSFGPKRGGSVLVTGSEFKRTIQVDNVPRVLFNFGDQPKANLPAETYKCALPTPYIEDDSEPLADRAINIGALSTNTQEGTGNLKDAVWKNGIDFIRQTRELIFKSNLTPGEVKMLVKHGAGVSDSVAFRFTSMKSKLKKGVIDQEVTGYRLASSNQRVLKVTEDVKPIVWD